MVYLSYHGAYDDDEVLTPMTHSVKMFAIGEKYLIEPLQAFAADRLLKLILNCGFDCENDLDTAIVEVYNNTSGPKKTLRSALIDYFAP